MKQNPCPALWRALCWCWLYAGLCPAAVAQRAPETWYFGYYAGVSFATGWPVPLLDGALASGEGCAAAVNSAGGLQLYTDGITAWNQAHQPLVNGTDLGGFFGFPTERPANSATQGALIVPHPGNGDQYFLFGVDAAEHGLQNGLQVALADMSRQNGRGEVLSKRARLPTPTLTSPVTEKLAAVRHANGRDVWVLVHGWQTNAFLAFLVTPAGVSPVPVATSTAGTVHQGGGGPFGNYNAIGYMAFSPDGRRLAVTQFSGGVELFDFDAQTGLVANPRPLPPGRGTLKAYGVAFSPSSNVLYAAGSDLVQYDLLTGSQQIVAFGQSTGPALGAWAVQLGPDGRLYLASPDRNALDSVEFPDVVGPHCGVRFNTVPFAGPRVQVMLGLPNQVAERRPVPAGPAVGFTVAPACAGQPVRFAAAAVPAPAGAVFDWDFGDPAAGPANAAAGAAAAHVFSAPGAYTVRVRMHWPGAAAPTTAQQRVVLEAPAARALPRVQVLCPGSVLELRPTPQPAGTAFRWDNGFTGSVQFVNAPGTYWADITSPQGCPRRDSVRVVALPELLTLGPDTATCFAAPLVLRVAGAPDGLAYSWPDGSRGTSWAVTAPGNYAVQVGASGCEKLLQRRVEVAADCGALVPNIITPNGDEANDAWVLRGLNPADWGVEIYSRWGQRVYAQAAYDNQWRAEGLPSGHYFYQLTYRRGAPRRLRGWVEVVR